MAAKKGIGLLMVWVDVPAEAEEDFNRWYNEEHIADLLAIPGVLDAARYVAVSGGPKHLACYDLESPDVTSSPGYLKLGENRSEWSRRASPSAVGTNLIVNTYQQIHPEGVSPAQAESGMAPALQIGRMSVSEEVEDEFNHWYNTVYVPNYDKVPGCIRGRRYRAVSGAPKYSVVYEFQHENVSKSPEWATARDAHPDNPRMRSLMTHEPGSPGIYEKTFPA